ncbi:MAG: SDR family oxidoreductase [Halobacteria archaeon]
MDPKGRTVLVTGGGTGIGAATARRLAAAGARVALMGRRPGPLESVAREIRKERRGGRVVAVPGDVSKPAEVQSCVARAEKALGPVDILVNNAAVLITGPVAEQPLEEFRRMMEINYFGPVMMARAVLPGMRRRGSGHIVTVASVAGRKSISGYGAYAATKFAVIGFMDALRQELHGSGIGVSTVLPGAAATPIGDPFAEKSPLARMSVVRPEMVAGAILEALLLNKPQVYVPKPLQTLALMNELSPRGADLVMRLVTGGR